MVSVLGASTEEYRVNKSSETLDMTQVKTI